MAKRGPYRARKLPARLAAQHKACTHQGKFYGENASGVVRRGRSGLLPLGHVPEHDRAKRRVEQVAMFDGPGLPLGHGAASSVGASKTACKRDSKSGCQPTRRLSASMWKEPLQTHGTLTPGLIGNGSVLSPLEDGSPFARHLRLFGALAQFVTDLVTEQGPL